MQIISRALALGLLLAACRTPPVTTPGPPLAAPAPLALAASPDQVEAFSEDAESQAFFHYIRGVSAELEAMMSGSEANSLVELERSVDEFESVVKLGYSKASVHLNLARSLRFLAGRAADPKVSLSLYERASGHYEEAIFLSPSPREPLDGLLAIELEVFRRTPAELAQHLRRLVERDRSLVPVWSKLAELYVQMGRSEDAREVYVELSKARPTDGQMWLARGRAEYAAQKFQDAIDSFGQAIRLRRTEDEVYEAMRQQVLSFYGLGRLDQARTLLDELVERQPAAADNWVHLAEFHLVARDHANAELAAQRALSIEPRNFYANVLLGQVLLASGRPRDGIAVFERLTQLWPGRPEGWRILGEAQFNDGLYAPAIESLEQAVRIDPQPRQARFSLAEAYRLSGRLKEAEVALTQLASEAPENAAVLRSLFFLKLDRKDFSGAHALSVKVLALDPGSHVSHYMMGAVLERLGRLDESIVFLKHAVRLMPSFAGARNYLGYLYADHGIHLEASVLEIQTALSLEPGNGSFLDSLGWAHFKAGRLDEALKYLSLAAAALDRTGSPEPLVLEHLGDVLFELSCYGRAATNWERALTIDAAGERRVPLQLKLQRVEKLPHRPDACRSPDVSSPKGADR